LKILSKKNRIL